MVGWHSVSKEDVLSQLKTSLSGISPNEVEKRRKEFGPNALKKVKGPTMLSIFLNQFRNPLVYLLIIASIASYFVGESFDSLMIMVIVLLNALLGFYQDWKAEKAIEALSAMFSKKARVIREGHDNIVDAVDLVPGDIIILEAGYEMPADARVIDCADLQTQEASLTGESQPIRKTASLMSLETRMPDRTNMVYAGTVAVNGFAKAVVVDTGMNTELGKIAGLTQSTESPKTHIEEVLESIAKKLVVVFLLLSASVSAIGIMLGRPLMDMLLIGIALAVAAVPEGLPAVVTITFALGLQRLSKVNTLVRRLPATETLGAITYIASDKTGTLTKNEMTVKKIFVDGKIIDVEGTGYSLKGGFSDKPQDLYKLLEIGALCNHASVEGTEVHGDPTEAALIVSAAKLGITSEELDKKHHILGELSFSESRKMMSVVTKDHGTKAAILNNKGAPENVLSNCSHYLQNGKVLKLDKKTRAGLLETNEEFAAQGYRVLGIAYRDLDKWDDGDGEAETGMVYVGSQVMIDPVRPEAIEAIKMARTAGIKITVVTGDHKATASAITKQIGLMDEPGAMAVDGAELDAMDDKELEEKIHRIKVFARVTPEQKMRVLNTLQKKGEIVAMTGDGVNDAPALKKADIGVAMGIKGTDVAKQTAQIVLADDNFMSIVRGIGEGRGIMINIKKFVYYLLSCNLAEVLILFFGMLFNWPLILLPVQLLWINLVTDSVTALSLGLEPRPLDVMKRPPSDPKENLLSARVLVALFGIGLLVAIVILALFSIELGESEDIARTMAFIGLIMAENYNLFNFKSFNLPLHKTPIFDNKYLIASVLFTITLSVIIIEVPMFAQLFHLVPLDFEHWIAIFGLGAIVLVAGETYKNLVYYKVLKI